LILDVEDGRSNVEMEICSGELRSRESLRPFP
jgi:hypothetical protein